MRNFIRRFIKNEAGATAIEYGLIASLIAVAIITATQRVARRQSRHPLCCPGCKAARRWHGEPSTRTVGRHAPSVEEGDGIIGPVAVPSLLVRV
jgi:pilus assembly protein Flp/PilA